MEDSKEGMGGKHCDCGCCGGGWGGGHHHHHHGPWRILIKIVILVLVFWAGTQFGELKASRGYMGRGGWGGYMMSGYGGYGGGTATPSTTTQQ